MKNLLVSMLCITALISCNDEMVETMPENVSEDASLRAAAVVHPLDRSLTIPLWEYESTTTMPLGHKDYYYQTHEAYSPASITVNGRVYTRTRMVCRIFKESFSYGGRSKDLNIWYSPSRQQHRISTSFSQASVGSFPYLDLPSDFVKIAKLGEVVSVVATDDRPVYWKDGMLETLSEQQNRSTNAMCAAVLKSLDYTVWYPIGSTGLVYEN